jgi:hypothetical protein
MGCVGDALRMNGIYRSAKDLNPGAGVLVIFLVEWSDCYDPSGSVKGGRSSCHCKSTYIPPPLVNNIVLINLLLYPLARRINVLMPRMQYMLKISSP